MPNFQNEFPLDHKLCYLNHAAVAPWPSRTSQAISSFALENNTHGATNYLQWLKVETTLRQQLKSLLNAVSTDEIALQKSTSEGLSAIAYGIDWKQGDSIVITDQEFPSNRIVWESLANKGVRVITAALDCNHPEASIINACDTSTRLVSISSVQYGTGVRVDLKEIGTHCNQQGILFCIDAIQSLGAIPMDVQDIGCDFVVADAHKWMLGPEGIAVFYIKSSALNQLSLNQFGWHMIENPGNYDTLHWEVASNAKRFECGSPNMIGIHGFSASLSLLLEIGLNNIEQMLSSKIDLLLTLLQNKPGITILSPTKPARRAGIVTFRTDKLESQALYQQLMKQNVICAYRGGGVRLSPHFYTPDDVLTNAVKLIP